MSALGLTLGTADAQTTISAARAVAKEAYVYGFPIVDNSRVQYAYFVDRENAEFKAPFKTPPLDFDSS